MNVAPTPTCRRYAPARHLPRQFILLYDHQDGGVILLDTITDHDTGENKIYDVAWESVPDDLTKGVVHENYLAYVKEVLCREKDFIEEDYIDFDPAA